MTFSDKPVGEAASAPELPKALQMMLLITGFQVSQALYAVARLNIATELLDGPRSVADLSAAVGCPPMMIRRLLRDLSALGVFSSAPDDVVALGPLGHTLADGPPDSVRDLALTQMETHYLPFTRLVDTIRGQGIAADLYYGQPFFDWLSEEPERVATFSRAMANITAGAREGLFDDYRLPGPGVVADIGGATGEMLAALILADDDPQRRGVLFDLPHVVEDSRKVLSRVGLTDRVQVVGGDFFTEVPAADHYVLSTVLHDWDDEACEQILRNIADAGSPAATVTLAEVVMPEGDEWHPAKASDLVMLGMLGGRERTREEFAGLLARAGFTLDQVHLGKGPYALIIARRTSSA